MVDINKVVIGYCPNEKIMLDAYWFLKEFSNIKEGDKVLEKTKYNVLWYDEFFDDLKDDYHSFDSIENNFMESFFAPACSCKECIEVLMYNILCKDSNTTTVAEILEDITYYNNEFENAKQRFVSYLRDNSDINIIDIGKEKELIREEKGFNYNYD